MPLVETKPQPKSHQAQIPQHLCHRDVTCCRASHTENGSSGRGLVSILPRHSIMRCWWIDLACWLSKIKWLKKNHQDCSLPFSKVNPPHREILPSSSVPGTNIDQGDHTLWFPSSLWYHQHSWDPAWENIRGTAGQIWLWQVSFAMARCWTAKIMQIKMNQIR